MKKAIGMALLTIGLTAASVFAAGSIDNSVWKATMKDKDGTQSDMLIFANGQFISTKCVPYGYGSTPYKVSPAKESAQWSTTQNSGKDKTSWTGELKGDTMSGKFTHVSADGTQSTSDWTATKQPN